MTTRYFILGIVILTGVVSYVVDQELLVEPEVSNNENAKDKNDPFAQMTDEQWKQILTPEQFRVCRKNGTEAAHSGEYCDTKEEGVYRCVCCNQELFLSQTKFDSGTGWPSYWQPINSENVGTKKETVWFATRVEVHCSRCGSHLGHVFDDGILPNNEPTLTGKRYCINSVSLKFEPSEE